jgi:DNA-binding CsgD family transcriptional regulator
LFITTGSLYQHLARTRKKFGAHNNYELLYLLLIPPEHVMTTLRFTLQGKRVFLLILEGLTSKEISARLNLGVNGIKRQKEKMLLQNGCATMRELIAKYYSAAGGNTETDTPAH